VFIGALKDLCGIEDLLLTTMAKGWNTEEGWPEAIPRVATKIVPCEHKPGHRPFNTYKLPKWVRHPDHQKPIMYVQPEDYMGTRLRHNELGLNVAHVGAQCHMFEGQGFKMLTKATPEEIQAQDLVHGFTPLHWAVLCDNPKAVIWLLKNGADRDAEDFKGRKAEDLVEEHWGDMGQRYWEQTGPMKDYQREPQKVFQKRAKQMKEAFKLNDQGNEYDIDEYKMIQV